MQDDDNDQPRDDPTDEEKPGADPLAQEKPDDEQIERSDEDETQPPSVKGEESASGSASKPSSDDDVGEMMEEVTGQEPENGETLADQVEEAERLRRGMPPKEQEENEQDERNT